ncbi:hypothetical protein [Stakelama pacifica]|uniref:Lipoprotein n=1 Tax=Stakelama pacifica TaxID=517720 RepID=A0A4R6FNP8_9SPHN|nr:hypothetical protein [Stakelama pacifica]MAX00925.1 hypothetical protein [Sphingomonas sp.]TDN82324.1 hypothetical protein EV664_106132 [Stakelama pacifica]GGO95632.1 hypothetical protein GCM10011329_20240 [Stakelama pacifica]
MRTALILAPIALLAGCGGNDHGGHDDDSGTSITISGQDENGQAVLAKADGNTGEVSLNMPGFEGKLKVPRLNLDAGDVDIDGVPLYPGSTISDIHIDAKGEGPNKGRDKVNFTFESPASAEKVRDWFRQKFADKGTPVKLEGDRLIGATKNDGGFELAITPAGPDRAQGRLQLRN